MAAARTEGWGDDESDGDEQQELFGDEMDYVGEDEEGYEPAQDDDDGDAPQLAGAAASPLKNFTMQDVAARAQGMNIPERRAAASPQKADGGRQRGVHRNVSKFVVRVSFEGQPSQFF
jgi:hypothetical protein